MGNITIYSCSIEFIKLLRFSGVLTSHTCPTNGYHQLNTLGQYSTAVNPAGEGLKIFHQIGKHPTGSIIIFEVLALDLLWELTKSHSFLMLHIPLLSAFWIILCICFSVSKPIRNVHNGSRWFICSSKKGPVKKGSMFLSLNDLTSGNLTVCYWKWPSRNRDFSH